MTTTMRIAVAGATGRVGHHLVDVLTARGHEVVAIARSTGVDVITGDGLAEALGGRRIPGVGFALGVDRIVLTSVLKPEPEVDVYLISETTAGAALIAASLLREAGFVLP